VGSDFVELGLALLLALFAFAWRPTVENCLRRLAENPLHAMAFLAALPVVLRLLLLPHHPVPVPDIYDEFGHLLVADTLRHFRLANPPHALHQFFETFFVLQQPTYSSIYPLGQGIALALGRMIFGLPWAGVLLSTAAFCAACYWMLRGWTTPGWAFIGGLLAVVEFGPLSAWMNSYWGGSFAATAGCLVFGTLPRLRTGYRTRNAVLLGVGLGMHWLTRPFESLFLFLSVALFFVPALRRPNFRGVAIVLIAFAPAMLLSLLQNKAVTGSWTTLPYTLSQYQYGVPASLTFQANPVPHNQLTPQQELEYRTQCSFHGSGPETLARYFERLEYRIRFYRFFLLPALWLVLPAFFAAMREFRFVWVALTLALFALGTNFFPFFQLHYLAGVTCLFILMSVTGLSMLTRLRIRGQDAGREAAWLILLLCAAHFLLWYGVHLFDTSMRRYESWDYINHENPEARIFVKDQLARAPGRQLVFVRYSPRHRFQEEWVYNDADIDAARTVWARDLGAEENEKLRHYYPDRTVWLLEPDTVPPSLTAYGQ
jgi:hypothetical protein